MKLLVAGLLASVVGSAASASAIGEPAASASRADYERAWKFQNADKLVSRLSVRPNWIDGGDRFWFVDQHRGVKTFVLVDPAAKRQLPAFDHSKLAGALSAATGKTYRAEALPFGEIQFLDQGRAIGVMAEGSGWRCAFETYKCEPAQRIFGAKAGEELSPDKRWAIFLRDHNLWARNTATNEEFALTKDGIEDYDYGSSTGVSTGAVTSELLEEVAVPTVTFSPDSRKFVSYRIDTRNVRKLGLVQSVAGAAPRTFTYRYPVAGDDSVPQVQLMVFDLERRTNVVLQHPPINRATTFDIQICWDPASTQICFTEDARGYKSIKLYVADADTGSVRLIATERSDKYVLRFSANNDFPMARILGTGRKVIWSSERDGWNHLYLWDSQGDSAPRQLTRGEWLVQRLLHIDHQRGQIYFMAAAREADNDPYQEHLYRIYANGTGLKRLTKEPGAHTVAFSPTGRYFVDTFSKVDAPPVSVLRTADGTVVRELQRADIEPLRALGWKEPEPFKAKARDGVTDIYGTIYRPSNFDPGRKYPVLDGIYPGPQTLRVSHSFQVYQWWKDDIALAELGFIVVNIDGMGTPGRSRTFREVSYGNLGDGGGLEDHIAALRQLAGRYPYLDLNRVGIYGHSGGGYATARALLQFPEFYKVGVASAGNHDQRSYWADWGERFQGFPVGENYVGQANASLAANLTGKLLLVHGSLDDNVHPANTLQLVDALIAANKDFDLLIMPNRNHGLVDLGRGKAAPRSLDPYFIRKRWDYFVKHLQGVQPPKEFSPEEK